MTWDAAGSIALGIVVMYVAMYFVTRFASHTMTKLTALIGVLLGGTVVTFLVDRIGANKANFGQYAVGLLIGLVAYVILHWIRTGKPPSREELLGF